MSGDKLPPMPPGGKWEKFGGIWRGIRRNGNGLNDYAGATPADRAEGAWLAWERDSGMTRADYEQRERALASLTDRVRDLEALARTVAILALRSDLDPDQYDPRVTLADIARRATASIPDCKEPTDG